MANMKLVQAVEAYFTDLRMVLASGADTDERSLYGPLANLLNAVGGTLRPKVSVCRSWPTKVPGILILACIRLGRCSGAGNGKGRFPSAAWWRSSRLTMTRG